MSFIDNIKAIPITDYAQKCGYSLVKKGSRYISLVEHDSVMIDIEKNCFWRNSVFKIGAKAGSGSIIDFAIEFMGYDHKRAIRELAVIYNITDKDNTSVAPISSFKAINNSLKDDSSRSVFTLPEKADNMKAVFRYLIKERCIDVSVVRYFVSKKMLYQDAKHNNCVFVSYKFACLRSTGSKKFAIDVVGCDYNECFYFRPENSKTLVVAESVIDIMSIMTFFVKQNKRFTDFAYLSLSGTNKLASLFYHLRKENHINKILLAFDNDSAGLLAQETAIAKLKEIGYLGVVEIFTPQECKDWNEYICK